MRIAVIDGQGGGIGRHLVQAVRRAMGSEVEILALGTNSLATSLMIRAGANEGATGENAVLVNAGRVEVILGSLGVVLANSMLGEMTPAMAEAVATSPARKLLLAVNRSSVEVVGSSGAPLPHQIEALVARLKELDHEKQGGENHV